MIIYKQTIPVAEAFRLDLPKSATVLCVQTQYGIPCVWYLFEETLIEKAEKRAFVMLTTGHPFAGRDWRYVGTFQLEEGRFVGHIFEEPR